MTMENEQVDLGGMTMENEQVDWGKVLDEFQREAYYKRQRFSPLMPTAVISFLVVIPPRRLVTRPLG